MFKHGPVDVVLLYAKSPRFDGKILAELQKQVAAGTIRVLDAMVVVKDPSGVRKSLDIEDLPAAESAKLGFAPGGLESLFSSRDTEEFYNDMEPGTTLMGLAIEQTWAVGLLNTMVDAGTEMAAHFAVPAASSTKLSPHQQSQTKPLRSRLQKTARRPASLATNSSWLYDSSPFAEFRWEQP